MSLIDTRTLLLVIMFTLFCRAAVLAYVWRVNRDYQPLRYWVPGTVMVTIGTLLVALRDIAPASVSILLAQALVIPGWMVADAGIVIASGRKPPWRSGVGVSLVALCGIYWFSIVEISYPWRNLWASVPAILFDGYAAYTCFRHVKSRQTTTLHILGGILLVQAASNIWKTIATFQLELTTLLNSGPMFIQFFFVTLVFLIVSTALFVLLSSQQIQDKLAAVISDRTRDAEQLRLSQGRLELALEGAGDGEWEWDVPAGKIFLSQRASQILGYEAGEIGEDIDTHDALIHPDDMRRLLHDRTAIDEGRQEIIKNERRMRHKDGRWLWISSRARVVSWTPGGKADRVFGVWTNIEERKRAEEKRVHAVLEASVDGMLMINQAGRIIFANTRAGELFGYPDGGLLEQAIEILIPGTFRSEHVGQRIDYMLSLDKRKMIGRDARRVRALRGDGSEFPVEVSLSPFVLNGEPVVIATAHDVSQRDEAERAVRQLNESLEIRVNERTRDLEEARRQADAANRAKGDFVANMSHEIRTPMNAVLGMTHLALRNETNPQQRDYLSKIHQAGEHLLGIINDILDFSKIEAGKLEIDHMSFDLHDLLENLRQMTEDKAAEKGLQLSIDVPADIPRRLRGDPLRLGQILINYANNALKFTSQGQISVRVKVSEPGQTALVLCFEVSDTGIGIPDAVCATLFQPFQQANTSITRRFGGTGLGLTISRQLAEMMGGAVGVSSVEGQGSTFWFTACVELDTSEPVAHVPITLQSNATIYQQLHGRRVLLAEDNSFNQQVAQEMLSDVGIAVALAENGQEAIDWLRRERFDCVLMDLQMPVMDGLTATRALRALPETAELVVIAMTANASRDDEQRCREAGMNDFISKPIRPDHLYACLVRWIGDPKQPANTLLPQTSAVDSVPAAAGQIDRAILLQLGRGNPARLEKLVNTFLASAEDSIHDLDQAITANNLSGANAIGHKLKSGARWVGAMQLADLCEELDRLRAENDLARIRGIHTELTLLMPKLRSELRSALDTLQTSREADS